MANGIKRGLDWFPFSVSDWMTNSDVLNMSASERGVYISLLVAQWLGKGWLPISPQSAASLALLDDRSVSKWLLKWPHLVSERSPNGLQMGNSKLLSIWNERTCKNESSIERRENRESRQIDNSLLAELLPEEPLVEENLGAIQPGEPGYYKRGQYLARKPKDVFKSIAATWAKIKGESTQVRYGRYTEEWETLCGTRSADIIVPAFELWVIAENPDPKELYPHGQFVKVAQEYMERVLPYNTVKPIEQTEAEKQSEAAAIEAWRLDHIEPKTTEELLAEQNKDADAPDDFMRMLREQI